MRARSWRRSGRARAWRRTWRAQAYGSRAKCRGGPSDKRYEGRPRLRRALPQPDARMRRAHRVARDRHELAFEHVDIDVVAQAVREQVECALRVIALAVEAAVDEGLDTSPHWLEERDDGERRCRYGDRAAGGEWRQQE